MRARFQELFSLVAALFSLPGTFLRPGGGRKLNFSGEQGKFSAFGGPKLNRPAKKTVLETGTQRTGLRPESDRCLKTPLKTRLLRSAKPGAWAGKGVGWGKAGGARDGCPDPPDAFFAAPRAGGRRGVADQPGGQRGPGKGERSAYTTRGGGGGGGGDLRGARGGGRGTPGGGAAAAVEPGGGGDGAAAAAPRPVADGAPGGGRPRRRAPGHARVALCGGPRLRRRPTRALTDQNPRPGACPGPFPGLLLGGGGRFRCLKR